jgi:hypothetical protein
MSANEHSALALIMSPSLLDMMKQQCLPIGHCVLPVDLEDPCFCPPTHAGRHCDRCATGRINYPHCTLAAIVAASDAAVETHGQAQTSTAAPGAAAAVTAASEKQALADTTSVTKSFTAAGCHLYTCGCSNFDVFDSHRLPSNAHTVFEKLELQQLEDLSASALQMMGEHCDALGKCSNPFVNSARTFLTFRNSFDLIVCMIMFDCSWQRARARRITLDCIAISARTDLRATPSASPLPLKTVPSKPPPPWR